MLIQITHPDGVLVGGEVLPRGARVEVEEALGRRHLTAGTASPAVELPPEASPAEAAELPPAPESADADPAPAEGPRARPRRPKTAGPAE